MIVQKYKKMSTFLLTFLGYYFSTPFLCNKIIICCKYRVSQQNGLNFSEI